MKKISIHFKIPYNTTKNEKICGFRWLIMQILKDLFILKLYASMTSSFERPLPLYVEANYLNLNCY